MALSTGIYGLYYTYPIHDFNRKLVAVGWVLRTWPAGASLEMCKSLTGDLVRFGIDWKICNMDTQEIVEEWAGKKYKGLSHKPFKQIPRRK